MSNMTCATCHTENVWKPCEKCDGTGAVMAGKGRDWGLVSCSDCKAEGGRWVCECEEAGG